MKRCPLCNQIFNDEDVFCLDDGSALVIVNQATNDTPTQVLSYSSSETLAKAKNVRSLYWILGVMALAIVFLLGGIFFVLFRQAVAPAAQSFDNRPRETDNSTPKAENSSPPPIQSSLPPLTAETVRNLVERWLKAQNTQNFSVYQDCYGQPFLGIKRKKSGSVTQMNYSQWMNDRRRMLAAAVGLDVEAQGLQIAVEGDTATAEFEQYYRSRNYSDHGPKILKMKMFPDGLKIVYEDLKASD